MPGTLKLGTHGKKARPPGHRARSKVRAPHQADRDRVTEADRLVALGFLAGGVAHQINNALTPMRLSLGRLTSFELSRRPLTAEGLHRIELLQDAREGVARIERVLRELKSFSQTEDCASLPIDVSALLQGAVGLAAHEIRHRARLVCDYGPIPAVQGKPAELRQVFLNLLINAAHAIPEGGAHLNEIRVTTHTDPQGRALIEIADTGSGMPSDVIVRVFEPFFTTCADGTGLGLGLAVSRDVIAALDGQITIDSVVGKGTTVRIALPPSGEVVLDTIGESSAVDSQRSRRRRILIVDDDRPVAAAIALELEAHDVVVASSGREALGILRHDKDFDMILCDLMMPEVSGIDVYESLRLVEPALLSRIVLMTGGAFTVRARRFLSRVDVAVVEKPFDAEQLHALVRTLDHRRELSASPGQAQLVAHS